VLWAHIAPLWAACADAERSVESIGGKAGQKGKDFAQRRRKAKVGTCRVRPSLVWLIALFRSQGGILVKKIPVHRWVGPPRARIYADASSATNGRMRSPGWRSPTLKQLCLGLFGRACGARFRRGAQRGGRRHSEAWSRGK
jgi:hypothetical protein